MTERGDMTTARRGAGPVRLHGPTPGQRVRRRRRSGVVLVMADGATITAYQWDFAGDGETDLSSFTSPQTSHSYTEAGTYDAVLTVTDSAGNSASAALVLRVIDAWLIGSVRKLRISSGLVKSPRPDCRAKSELV